MRIPYPDVKMIASNTSQEFLSPIRSKQVEMTTSQLAAITPGLNYVASRSMLCAAQYSDDGLTFADVRAKKKEIIEAECAGLIEFITPRYGLDSVGGLKGAKDYLRDIAETIRRGNTDEAPMGILISGPVGTGKTFLAECFAKDCGLNVVEFRELPRSSG